MIEEPVDPDVVQAYELETWTRCAATYLDHFAGLTRETIPLLRDAANIRSGSTVLDLGSGPGHVAGALAEAVVSNFVVHHLARPHLVFREVSRVLEPGGSFAFVVFERPEAQSSIGAFLEAVAAHHDSDELPHGPLFGADQSAYESVLAASGLSDVHFEVHDISWRSDTVEPVLQAFLEWGNIAALPQDVQRKIKVTARESLETYREGAGYAFPHTVLLGTAVRLGMR